MGEGLCLKQSALPPPPKGQTERHPLRAFSDANTGKNGIGEVVGKS